MGRRRCDVAAAKSVIFDESDQLSAESSGA